MKGEKASLINLVKQKSTIRVVRIESADRLSSEISVSLFGSGAAFDKTILRRDDFDRIRKAVRFKTDPPNCSQDPISTKRWKHAIRKQIRERDSYLFDDLVPMLEKYGYAYLEYTFDQIECVEGYVQLSHMVLSKEIV